MGDRNYYTQVDCDEVIRRMKNGYEYVKDLQKQVKDEDVFFVYLFSDVNEINYYTLYYLPVVRREMNVSCFVIVTPYEDVLRGNATVCSVPYKLFICSREDMMDISTYYTSFPSGPNVNNKTYRVVVNGSADSNRDRLMKLMGYKGIDPKAIVAYAIYKW